MSESFDKEISHHGADEEMGAIPGVRKLLKAELPSTGSGAAILYSRRAAD